MEELIRQLEGVSNSYQAFVHGVTAVCKANPDVVDVMKQYIKDNPEATSSDITEKLYDLIEL